VTPLRPVLIVAVLAIAGCGSGRDHSASGDARGADGHADDGTRADALGPTRDAAHDAAHDATNPDAFPSVLDVRIDCHNDCTLIAHPPSIAVTAGTSFQVNWINVGDTQCDVAKIDEFNQVPIVLGLEPGTSYHDAVHEWCGTEFTGTFDFQISICTLPSLIPVNCGAS
jgi:hypothetical protein